MRCITTAINNFSESVTEDGTLCYITYQHHKMSGAIQAPGTPSLKRSILVALQIEETGIILDSISDGVFTVDHNWLITSFNHAAEEITGVDRAEAIGQPCSYVFRASICEGGCALRQTMETGKSIKNLPIYIIKANGEKIPVSISTALLKDMTGKIIGGVETFRDLSVEEELKRELKGTYTFEDITSRNHLMRNIFQILPMIAESPSTVIVEGESGTGKELVCRAIHNLSSRKNKPFVAVNCAALPETLLESELFGYKAGAFTDAKSDKKGQFALAEGGTILLDEIGDMSPALQVKMLRFLQEREYTPVGAESTVKADVRILAATNRDLEDMVGNGAFRRDLYYRLNVMRITLPPLRERKEDIPLLAERFIRRFNLLYSRDITGVNDSAMAALMHYNYPGNIREFENAIEHAFVLCRESTIMPQHLPDQFRAIHGDATGSTGSTGDTLLEIETAAIREALRRNNNNRTAAARELGIHKTTLHRKLRTWHINIPD